jgi:phosphoglycolate phosphatase
MLFRVIRGPPHDAMAVNASTVLLDLDGTLVDSRPGILASCRAALWSLGHEPIEPMKLEQVIGPPMEQVMQWLLAPYRDDRVAEAVAAYRTHYGAVGMFSSTVYAGIPQMLDALRSAGRRLFLATSKRTVFARRILEHRELAGRFDGIYGSEPDGRLDDKAALIAHILGEQALRAEDCVMVGDRHYDIIGAHANGVRAVGVLWGYGTRAELATAGADWLADAPERVVPADRA